MTGDPVWFMVMSWFGFTTSRAPEKQNARADDTGTGEYDYPVRRFSGRLTCSMPAHAGVIPWAPLMSRIGCWPVVAHRPSRCRVENGESGCRRQGDFLARVVIKRSAWERKWQKRSTTAHCGATHAIGSGQSARSLAVRRYFWRRLLGMRGMVRSRRPVSRAGKRYRSRKLA